MSKGISLARGWHGFRAPTAANGPPVRLLALAVLACLGFQRSGREIPEDEGAVVANHREPVWAQEDHVGGFVPERGATFTDAGSGTCQ